VIDEQLARRARLLPLALEDQELQLGAAPGGMPSAAALDLLRTAAGMQEVRVHPIEDVEGRIVRAYGGRRLTALVAADSEDAVAVLDALLDDAFGRGASDLHLDATADGLWARRRVDGDLHEAARLDGRLRVPLLARIKVRAGLDAAERRRPQDGRFEHAVIGGALDVRVATLPTRHGERATLRLLARDARAADLGLLGLPASCVAAIERALAATDGLIVVCGPTGSGKTTTLHAMLARLTDSPRNIVTLEDPIERVVAGTSQTQVEPSIGLTFELGLRHLLRHDPDVMLVGEVRDSATAHLAVEAAHTGHLVLASLHAIDAPSAFARLIELGVGVPLVADTLRLVIAQRLLAVPCPECDGTSDVVSCRACDGAGTRGRSAIAETIEVDESLRQLLREERTPARTHAALTQACRPRLRDVALRRAQAGQARRSDATHRTPGAAPAAPGREPARSQAPGRASEPPRYPRSHDL
jgi:type II secretory ATPase GspE/PulE/Tfp pilus assembly ATPase PilB-like protein